VNMTLIDRHIAASERLYKMMAEDHKERVNDLVEWADMNSSLMRKLDERDQRIRTLEAELTALKAANGM
jgi:flagellar biosynthesis/type III secretory pathway chaperone